MMLIILELLSLLLTFQAFNRVNGLSVDPFSFRKISSTFDIREFHF